VQIEQIRKCVADGADGVIVSAIKYDGVNDLVAELQAKKIPVIDMINGMSSDKISAKSVAAFYDVGYQAGRYIGKRHNKAGRKIRVAWFPGPKDAGWVKVGDAGFRAALKGTNIEIVATRYGDTGKSTQGKLVEEVLKQDKNLDYIVGTSVTAEAAIKLVRKHGFSKRTKIVAYYFSPGVFRGIKRGKILGAPTDSPAIQGRIALDQMVRILERKPYLKHVGPKILVFDQQNIDNFDQSTTLPPRGFRATFDVN